MSVFAESVGLVFQRFLQQTESMKFEIRRKKENFEFVLKDSVLIPKSSLRSCVGNIHIFLVPFLAREMQVFKFMSSTCRIYKKGSLK